MKKCLRLVITANFSKDDLENFIQRNAKKLSLEGTAQKIGADKVLVSVCGTGQDLDDFMDVLHKGSQTFVMEDLEAEPFLREKDYRDVFRIIE